ERTKNREHIETGATPFDDAFKTEVMRLKEFLVPLINELYGTEFDADVVDVVREANEHYLLAGLKEDDNRIPHRESDSCLRIGDKLYHVECQSTEDGNILIRLVEYNMQIGLENAHSGDTDSLIIDLPMTSLLMLRSGGEMLPRKTTKEIIYRHGESELSMQIPVLHVQSYSSEEIYARKLYFLIPFYTLRYEDTIGRIAKNPLETKDEYDKIFTELVQWFHRLEGACESREITEDEGRKLAELSRMILNHITRKMQHEQAERMVSTVGGKVLELQEDRWFAQGREEGR
ncbi:MAG: hypothetical protein K6G16_01640, partial [Lachnospiraceae bacterium]|nr:hypothetical protein [Lachnospiraceae bacterium]